MPAVAPLPPQIRLYDADRVGELIALLGAEQFWQLFTILQNELVALETATRSDADAPQLAATLHRLQGSASALGLVETALADRFPGLPRRHG